MTIAVEMKRLTPKDIFQKGQEIEVKITGVVEYGVFGVTLYNDEEYSGLIHKSAINPENKEVVPSRYFKYGDVVKATIRNFDFKGNMTLDARKFFSELTDYRAKSEQVFEVIDDVVPVDNVVELKNIENVEIATETLEEGEKVAHVITEELTGNLVTDTIKETETAMNTEESLIIETPEKLALSNVLTDQEVDFLYEEVKPTLLATLPTISHEGETAFKATIKKVGIVKFCLTLGTTISTFHVDPSIILADKVRTTIENKTRGCL